MLINEKLKFLRKKRGLTQAELAKLTNVSQQTIWVYEAGKQKPTTNTLIQLAKVLGVKADDLLNDERSVTE